MLSKQRLDLIFPIELTVVIDGNVSGGKFDVEELIRLLAKLLLDLQY